MPDATPPAAPHASPQAASTLPAPTQPEEATVDRPSSDAASAALAGGACRYRVLRPHARGGLGEVFVAEDTELHREVALKQLRPGRGDDPASRSRFLLEAEVCGRLEHPGVVPVYGLGTDPEGRPYYAMRFIQGESLHEAIRCFHAGDEGAQAPGARRLALSGLLTRFVAVCNAVAYAHSRGVIHRDLKPANVMLGKYGETLVVDWGLAKAVGSGEGEARGEEEPLQPSSGDGLATQAGAALGTPAYMSPEQATGRLEEVGPASDVYGLGATLYHLLTGLPPVRGATQAELLGKASRGDWPAPRQVNRGVPAPLDAVCRKAMALRPADRYATAQALAADVERWLADEPVSAYRESLARRLGRWRRRHPVLVSVVVVALLLGGGFGVWRKVDADARAARAEREAADLERDVRAALDEADRLLGQAKWPEAEAAAQWAEGRRAGGGPPDLRARLEQARADLKMAADLEEVRLLQTRLQGGKFHHAAADPAFAKAFERYGLTVFSGDLDEAARRVVDSAIREQIVVALDQWTAAKPPGDRKGRKRLLLLARRADADGWRQRLRDQAVLQDRRRLLRLAEEAGASDQPPATSLILAHHLVRVGDWPGAVAVLRRAQQRHPGDFWVNFQLATHLAVNDPSRKDEILGFYRAALALRPQAAGVHVDLGVVLAEQGQFPEAEAAFRKAIALQSDFASAHVNLGLVLWKQGRLGQASAAFREALKFRPEDPGLINTLGRTLVSQGRLQEAETAFREAVRLVPKFAEARYNLAIALVKQRRLKEAEGAVRLALRDRPDYTAAYICLGSLLLEQGQFEAALTPLRRACELESKEARPSDLAASWLRDAERLRDLDQKLRAVLRGEASPQGAAETVALARVCGHYRRRYATAARLYAEAFTAKPQLADDLKAGHRFHAATAAALAAAGKGEDAAKRSAVERARLRGQALGWLRDDLRDWSGHAAKGAAQRREAAAALQLRLSTPDLAGVREAAALASLPEAEHAAWRRLWEDTAVQLKRWGAGEAKAKGPPN
jgi:Flp pilus assembly protein TadD/tRNA A-37 threonylcarbamoyl transferase component Bud32